MLCCHTYLWILKSEVENSQNFVTVGQVSLVLTQALPVTAEDAIAVFLYVKKCIDHHAARGISVPLVGWIN
jgi:hypothetical protein